MRWYELNPERLRTEKRLIARYHPGSKLYIKGGLLRVSKRVRTSRDTYLLEGIFSSRHPYEEMSFYITHPRLEGVPGHMYLRGRLCLLDSADFSTHLTAKVYLDWAIQWIGYYERWLITGEWPETNQGY